MTKVLVVGASGFIGFNIFKRLSLNSQLEIVGLSRDDINTFLSMENVFDVVIYCAGVNRGSIEEINDGNQGLLKRILGAVSFKRIIYFSSTLLNEENKHLNYVNSKLESEEILKKVSHDKDVLIVRLPNIFGKWSKPNHNSFLHTLMFKISNGEKYHINNHNEILSLVYIDDLVDEVEKFINKKNYEIELKPVSINMDYLEKLINKIHDGLKKNDLTFINSEFDYRIYATYLYQSNVVQNKCVTIHSDERGLFVELLKINSTQISEIICNPDFKRGIHYHNNKIEHFMVIEGSILFIEKNILNNKEYSTPMHDKERIWFTTRPGIQHTLYNNADVPAKILCISHDIFDKNNPDTFSIQ